MAIQLENPQLGAPNTSRLPADCLGNRRIVDMLDNGHFSHVHHVSGNANTPEGVQSKCFRGSDSNLPMKNKDCIGPAMGMEANLHHDAVQVSQPSGPRLDTIRRRRCIKILTP